jgi:hypothetical protein
MNCIRRDREVRQDQIIASFLRGACWQLARRSPTWLLLTIVACAWLLAGHQ